MARRMTKAQREWRPGMPKKRRSTKVLFASTVLMLEAFVVFFATLAVFGLRRDEIPPAVILTSGLVLAVVLVLTCAVVTKKWGIGLGWILQFVIIAGGFLEPVVFVVGIAFALTWFYGLRQGARVDRENVERDRLQAEWEKANPEEGSAV
ncbi:membrane protein [Arthrobacter sp. RIT-PI-e]|uniref:DUF4233 domain-containing protein n=1 Tax=Arthrobacter sp. RIT-PI-e TaxID=1681197 RepID=UPI000676AD31|nr:DUF4233 domain-containing protein [Arthrobacter sp. RIT-PI-e]KNC19111.1 membrane protein [Arthrobacter sp. RIT-PI-e]